MLVGQFGSFIPDFLQVWKGTIEEGDVFVTNDAYQMAGAVSHLNDVIVLVPIFFQHKIVGWAANFGHLTYVINLLSPLADSNIPQRRPGQYCREFINQCQDNL